MNIENMNENERKELYEVYGENFENFSEPITIEEFAKEYIRKCDSCGHLFYYDSDQMNDTGICNECESENNINESIDSDFNKIDDYINDIQCGLL